MPLNLSFTHMMVVAIVALVVLGPERLPGVARTAGNFYREWQRIKGSLEGEVREVINEFKEPFQEPMQQMHDSVKGVHDSVKGVVDDIRASGVGGVAGVAGAAGVGGAPGAASAGAVTVMASTVLPSLGGTDLFAPGPVLAEAELPLLAAPPHPETVAWLEPPITHEGGAGV